jgi:hypothetical protein
VELAQRLSTSSEGMSATVATRPGIRIITVQGLLLITNKAGKFFSAKLFVKERSNFCLPISTRPQIFSSKKICKILVPQLDNYVTAIRLHRKHKRCHRTRVHTVMVKHVTRQHSYISRLNFHFHLGVVTN